ncbi:MAG: peptide ABC transporter substrate-binding protein [Gammaproteobacteria bacterium]
MTRHVAALVLTCLAGLTACGERAPSIEQSQVAPVPDSKAEGVVFRRSIAGEPDSLDPHRSEEASTADILRDLYEGLTSESPDGTILPGVAERWEISADGLVYLFFLRSGARWSNGDDVTAEDFVAGLRRSVDPLTGSSYSQVLDPIKNADAILNGNAPVDSLGVVALEPGVLEITLKAPTPYFLGLLSHSSAYPIHGPSLETFGDGFARPGTLISNGPFVLQEWVVQSHLKLIRNNFYWGAANVALDTVFYYSLEEPASELKRYQAGDLDFTELIPNNRFKWIRENFGEELRVAPFLGIYYYAFNITRPPFDDVRLRQALNLAVDRQILTEKVTGVGELPAYGFVPPGVGGYEARRYDWADWDEAARLELAGSLYKAAGYSHDNPLRVKLYYNTGENHKKTAIAIASMWRQTLGVETELINEELRVLLDHRRDRSRWELMRLGWVGDYDDPNTFLEIMQTGHGQNDTGFADPAFDELLQKASQTLDPDKRMALLAQAEQRLIEGYPVVPLYFYVTKRLVKPWVLGYTPGIMDHNYSRDLSIDTSARGF